VVAAEADGGMRERLDVEPVRDVKASDDGRVVEIVGRRLHE
jgi:hypothetical protein